jgi:hypothetical protein
MACPSVLIVKNSAPFKSKYCHFIFPGDPTVAADAMQRLLTAQMQEKGRRLAQELPGFNWLEEKIRNGGVTTVLPPKRPLIGATHSRSNCGSSLHSSNSGARTVPTSEALGSTPSHEDPKSVMDAARNNVVPPLKSPPEYRWVPT